MRGRRHPYRVRVTQADGALARFTSTPEPRVSS